MSRSFEQGSLVSLVSCFQTEIYGHPARVIDSAALPSLALTIDYVLVELVIRPTTTAG